MDGLDSVYCASLQIAGVIIPSERHITKTSEQYMKTYPVEYIGKAMNYHTTLNGMFVEAVPLWVLI